MVNYMKTKNIQNDILYAEYKNNFLKMDIKVEDGVK